MLDELLKAMDLKLNLVVNLDVPHDVILKRIQDRWIHAESGRVYNMSYNPPKSPGFDDVTQDPLTKRPDDDVVSLLILFFSFFKIVHKFLTLCTV
jgi:adenylate kinase family enzyme